MGSSLSFVMNLVNKKGEEYIDVMTPYPIFDEDILDLSSESGLRCTSSSRTMSSKTFDQTMSSEVFDQTMSSEVFDQTMSSIDD